MSVDGCRWLSRSDSLPRPGHGLILVELTSLNVLRIFWSSDELGRHGGGRRGGLVRCAVRNVDLW
jgi:hypothetical protein